MTDSMTNKEAIDILRVINPPRESKRIFDKFMQARDMAIKALEKQEQTVDKCCETCKHKNRSTEESPCCDCYMSTAFDDSYEPYTGGEA